MQYNLKMDVVQDTTIPDGLLGESTSGEITVHKDLPCRINWSRAKEKVMFGKNDYLRDAKVYCRVVEISESDTIVINGDRYNIVGVVNVDEVNRQMVIDIIKIAE